MPELPEVQTTVDGLQLILKQYIKNIKINTNRLRYLIPKNIKKILNNKKIIKIHRIAKYIALDLSNNTTLIIHLGMSGRIKILKISDYIEIKHDHLILYLSNKKMIIFNDPRKFGFIDIVNTLNLKNTKYFSKLGLDPFDKKLNKKYLLSKFKKSKSSIKQILLNQKIISGIGNIYASEILFDATISPFLPANKLTLYEISSLIKSIKKIIKKAILFGGTSLKDYVAVDGTLGSFQNKFKVYNREGQKIRKFKILRAIQSGRSTFYCPAIQKSQFNPKLK